jgi:hypothetical protein
MKTERKQVSFNGFVGDGRFGALAATTCSGARPAAHELARILAVSPSLDASSHDRTNDECTWRHASHEREKESQGKRRVPEKAQKRETITRK